MLFTTNNNNDTVADNTIVINNQLTFKLTYSETEKLVSILNGMVSSRTATPTATTVSTPTTTTTTKDSKKFPNLGTVSESVGFCSRYANLIRYWENGFCPDKCKFGIKKALKEAGAEWDSKYGAFKFDTIEKAVNFMEAQRARG